jgi:zinc-ribbon domain
VIYCVRCGREIQENDSFCPSCGKPVRDVPLMPAHNRIAGHLRLLGILWIALSAFRFAGGTIMVNIFDHGFPPDIPPFVHNLLEGIGGTLICAGILGIIAGWGLLARQGWARMLAIVIGCIGLMDMPFGTALGVYTLWVLLPAESEQQYRRMAQSGLQQIS